MARRFFLVSLWVLTLTFGVGNVEARTWYVTPDGTGDAPTIQAGIDSAAAGDTVLVGCGTYYEHDVTLRSGICLRGETGDPSCVVLDALLLGRGIYCSQVDSTARIEGLTVRQGTNSGDMYGGGGILLWYSAPRMTDCVIEESEGSRFGGGIAVWRASLPFLHCVFRDNTCSGDGGGLCFIECPEINIEDCSFQANEATGIGAGILFWSTGASVLRCSFDGNVAASGGGGIQAKLLSSLTIEDCVFREDRGSSGGGYQASGSTETRMTGCTFRENTSTGSGGGARLGGGDVSVERCRFIRNGAARDAGGVDLGESFTRFADCVVDSNTAGLRGGAIHHAGTGGSVVVEACSLSANSAAVNGGGIQASGSSIQVRECVLIRNHAEDGGGISVHGGAPHFDRCLIAKNTVPEFGRGGGLFAEVDASPVLTSCTFAQNAAPTSDGGAIAVQIHSTVRVTRSILAFSSGGDGAACIDVTSDFLLDCCDIYGNADGDWVGCVASQLGLSGNFSADPHFCGPSSGDYTLASTSTCLPGQHPDGALCDLIGAYGQACTYPTSVEHTSWGEIKKMFR